MAGISNWFSFTSKEEREERSAEYFKRMFPLGAQQVWAVGGFHVVSLHLGLLG